MDKQRNRNIKMAQRHDENYNEQPMTRMGRIQQPSRRYRRLRHPSFTAAIWTANNPLLQRGEIGSEIDTGKLKVGDGVTYWNDLGYVAASTIPFEDITGDPYDNAALKDALDAKQDVLTAGSNIQIDSDNVISATDTTYTASNGVSIDSDNVISNSGVRAVASGTANGTISVNTNGTSADVAVTGLGSAAYTASSDYATAAQGALADNAANKDLSNLTSTGANIGNWSSNVTNCITEIPQDITVSLSDGTVTLAKGSKSYKADGTTITASTNVTKTYSTNGSWFLVLENSNYISQINANSVTASNTEPVSPSINDGWWDTANNKLYRYSGAWTEEPLPFALVTVSGGAISSIDHVFNGFGYIGSIIFALPGVKGLIPNGRNTDGTLKNSNLITSSVLTLAVGTGTATDPIRITSTLLQRGSINYNSEFNYNHISTYSPQNIRYVTIIGSVSYVSGKITSLKTKTPFHSVDYSDSEYIANCAMPSNKKIDLSASLTDGYVFNAPTDGYVYLGKYSTDSGQRIRLQNTSSGMAVSCWSSGSVQNLECIIAVSKGQNVKAVYSADGSTNGFFFVYSNGVK